MLTSRFGMDAHTCEAAAQAWAGFGGFGLAELDPLPQFVWRYQLPLTQDFIQAMADIS